MYAFIKKWPLLTFYHHDNVILIVQLYVDIVTVEKCYRVIVHLDLALLYSYITILEFFLFFLKSRAINSITLSFRRSVTVHIFILNFREAYEFSCYQTK